MDLLDLLWNADQERHIGDVRKQLERLRLERDLEGGSPRGVGELAAENVELKLRLALLVRLLIAKGVITAKEYAATLAEANTGG